MKTKSQQESKLEPKQDYYFHYIKNKILLSQEVDKFFEEINPSIFSKSFYFISSSLSLGYFKEIFAIILLIIIIKSIFFRNRNKNSQSEKKMKEIIEVLISNHESLSKSSQNLNESYISTNSNKTSKTKNAKDNKSSYIKDESKSFIKNRKSGVKKGNNKVCQHFFVFFSLTIFNIYKHLKKIKSINNLDNIKLKKKFLK